GRLRRTIVCGPLRERIDAEWRLNGRVAVIEMARAAGLELAGGPQGNDPIAATTTGVGELINEAIRQGARRVVVGLGGSASTDGGEGAVAVIERLGLPRNVALIAACDVTTTFVEAASVFAPQKGASPAQVALLTRRLERLAQVYEERYGVDVRTLPGSGAAGGLGGGLAALGAALVPGFDVVAEAIELEERVAGAALVVTGEGYLDEQSFNGKAVGGVVGLASAAHVPVLVVAGEAADVDVPDGVAVVSLVERFGRERALSEPAACVESVVNTHLEALDR
ncbi:MAG: glycerate kinase, partial [Acidimicrobiia bacterium]